MEIITGKLNRTVPFTTSHQTANHHAVRQSFYGKLYVFPIESAFEYSLLSIKWFPHFALVFWSRILRLNRTIPYTTFHQMVN